MEVRHSFLPVVILLLNVFFACLARFVVTPSSVTIEVEDGMERVAMFRCRHERIDAQIVWLINMTIIQHYTGVLTGSFRDMNGNLVQTLAIPAIPRYNESEVVCIATFLDGSPREETTPVALIISVTVSATPMPTTKATTPPSPTTPTPPTTSPTTTTNFSMTPTSQNRTVDQREAVFHCQHTSCDSIVWNVNDVSADDATNTRLDGGGFHSSLTIETLLNSSGSSVQCVCVFFRNTRNELSAPATLLVQGIPDEVKNPMHKRDYSSKAITAEWKPISSLNLTNINPDIMYGVELFMITCGKHVYMGHQDVTGNSTTDRGLDLMQIYEIRITARNNVPDAINGPSAKIKETFMSVNKSTLFKLARSSQVIMTLSDPIPSYYTLILNSVNGYGYFLVTNISVTRNGEVAKLQMEPVVPRNLLLNASIVAYGCEVHTVTVNELSTFDIQNITASSSQPGRIRVTGDFVDGSTATGVLLIVYSLTKESGVLKDVQYIVEEKSESNSISINVIGLSTTKYVVSVFALEDGRLFPRVATLPKNVTVAANETKRQMTIQYKVTNTSTGVCVNCTFLDNSTTGCLVVVHRRISQLNSSGLMNIKESRKFNRSGNTAYGCIKGVDLKDYQVGVIDGLVVSSTMNPNGKETLKLEGVIVGTTLGVVVFSLIAVAAVVVIMVRKLFRKRFLIRPSEAGPRSILPLQSSSTAVGIRRGSSGSNEYVRVPCKEDVSGGNEEEDSLLAPPLPTRRDIALSEDQLLDAQPMSESTDHERLDVSSQEMNPSSPDPTYAQPMLPKSSKPVCPPVTERVVYDNIDKVQNKEGLLYALTKLESSSKEMVVDDLHQVVYSEIQPHSESDSKSQNVQSVPDCSEQASNSTTAPTHTDPPPQPEPFTLELLFSYLLPMASVWKSLGEPLSVDEDLVDEIFTNNETDEACLREMLDCYMKRFDLKHNWEEIKAAEKKAKEGSITPDQVDKTETANTTFESGRLIPATTCTMSQESSDSGYCTLVKSSGSSELASSSSSALEDPPTIEFLHSQCYDLNVRISESQQCKGSGETIDNMQPQTAPVAKKDHSEERNGLACIQECDSSSTSSIIGGSNHFSSIHATIHRIPSHIPDTAIVNKIPKFTEIHDGVDEDENGIGTKWRGDTTTEHSWCKEGNYYPLNSNTGSMLPDEGVNHEEDSAVADEDFTSVPDLPNSPGTETVHSLSSHGHCTRQPSNDCAEDHQFADYCEFDDKLSVHIPSSPKAPCYHAHVSCPLSFVTNKECGEEPCTGQVAPKAIDYHQESHENMTEYSVLMMKQLGIGEQTFLKAYLGGGSSETDGLLIRNKEYKQSVQKTVVLNPNFSSTQVAEQVAGVRMMSNASRTTCCPLSTRSR